MKKVPGTWGTFRIVDLGGTVGGKTPSKAVPGFWAPQEMPWASPKDMKTFLLSDTEDRVSHVAISEAGLRVLPVGSVLMVTRSGILAHTFPVAVTMIPMAINQDIKSILPRIGMNAKYLGYILRANGQDILLSCAKAGTTVASVETGRLENLQFPLAPFNEQKRIADKLDSLLARVDACRERLDRVPGILKRFRQAVLAAATSGELTREWRETIGETNQWSTVELESVASDFSYGTAAKSLKAGKIPVLRMGNIQDGVLDWSDLVYTSNDSEIRKYKLHSGDVLFNRTNSPELVGKTAVYHGERDAIYAGYLIRVRCGTRLLPDFLNYCLGSPAGRDYCWQVKSDGVSQSNINARKLAAFSFGLPTVPEQVEIVRRVGSLFEIANLFERRHAEASQQIRRLTPSILAKAFRGELVPQDPNDEPASELLARIRDRDSSVVSKKPARSKVNDRQI